jgi:hypothetical protein
MPRCFVIQRFDKGPYDKRYRDVLVPAIRAAGLEPYRVDEDPSATILIEDIENGIRQSDICLADVTLDNPNIWYEIGFAHANGKSVVLICSEPRPTPFPFDVRHRQIIMYSLDSPSDFKSLANDITLRLEARLKNVRQVPDSNPDSVAILSSEISSLRKELSEIVRTITASPKPVKDKTLGRTRVIRLKDLEGIWKADDGAIFCARVVDGELLMPYDYHGRYGRSGAMTSHVYNCRLVGGTLFCRFAWFNSPISGVMVLNVVSASELRGGWWSAEHAPPELLQGKIAKTHAPIENGLLLKKKGTVAEFPDWANRYFADPHFYAVSAAARDVADLLE